MAMEKTGGAAKSCLQPRSGCSCCLRKPYRRNSYQLNPSALGDILQIPSKVKPQPQQTRNQWIDVHPETKNKHPNPLPQPKNTNKFHSNKKGSTSFTRESDRPSYSLLPSVRIKPLWRLPARHESWGEGSKQPIHGWPLEVMKVIFREFIHAVGMTQISEFVWDIS